MSQPKFKRNTPSWWRDSILLALQDYGRMSVRELTRELRPGGMSYESARKSAHKALRQLKGDGMHGGKIYIAAYVREQLPGMSKPYSAAKFALGTKRDARPLPPLTGVEQCQRYRDKLRRFAPSVFTFGAPFSVSRPRRIGTGFNAA